MLLEVAAIDAEGALRLSSVGLVRVADAKRPQLQQVLDRALGDERTPAIGRTTLIEHTIDVGSARPIKQRFYLVSKKIEKEMHKQVRDMLDAGIIEPSTSGWSGPVVMVRKANGNIDFGLIFEESMQ